ncbi:hypothetical protein CDAR_543221 [Caerostris darwini]|uniref:Uncharacterized protein n=1 Tax=Caerostris darwini TaxID=1538125 RepID=A0AAV4WZP0_9ARAC|nr:hypothetical protein CDAR_543221 [Caerostris darwini]
MSGRGCKRMIPASEDQYLAITASLTGSTLLAIKLRACSSHCKLLCRGKCYIKGLMKTAYMTESREYVFHCLQIKSGINWCKEDQN